MDERYVHIGRISEVLKNIELENSSGLWSRLNDYTPPPTDGLRKVAMRKAVPIAEARLRSKMIPIPRNLGKYLKD